MKEWEEELYRYRLTPKPPRKPLQAFIELYLETGDETHFAHFLHYYEPALNDLAIGYVQEYAMQGHFADIKSACVYGLLRAMQGYEKEKARLSHTRGMRSNGPWMTISAPCGRASPCRQTRNIIC